MIPLLGVGNAARDLARNLLFAARRSKLFDPFRS